MCEKPKIVIDSVVEVDGLDGGEVWRRSSRSPFDATEESCRLNEKPVSLCGNVDSCVL